VRNVRNTLTLRSSSWSFASDDTSWISDSQLTGLALLLPDDIVPCIPAACLSIFIGREVAAEFPAGADVGAVDMM
jgi:hypothetical protein